MKIDLLTALTFSFHSSVTMALVLSLSGCGGSAGGPPRRGIEGTVSYDKKPLEYGEIRFLPDPEGPITVATISSGKYQLPAENGVALGNVRVQINSLTKSTGPTLDSSGAPPSASGFVEIPKKYNVASELTANIPSGNGNFTLDFNLEK